MVQQQAAAQRFLPHNPQQPMSPPQQQPISPMTMNGNSIRLTSQQQGMPQQNIYRVVNASASGGGGLSNGHVSSAPSPQAQLPQLVQIRTVNPHSLQPQQQQHPAAQNGQDENSVQKCAKFFKTLLALSQSNRQGPTVTQLVNAVISGQMPPETFTTQLQRALNSTAQPHLLPFLSRTLPALRVALERGQVSIEGLQPTPQQPPLQNNVNVNVSLPQQQQPQQQQPQQIIVGQQRHQAIYTVQQPSTSHENTNHINSVVSNVARGAATVSNMQIKTEARSPIIGGQQPQRHVQQQPAMHYAQQSQIKIKAPSPATSSLELSQQHQQQQQPTTVASKQPIILRQVASSKQRAMLSNTPDKSFREQPDDDLNDVAAMGGVNLVEESQRIWASSSELLQTDTKPLVEPVEGHFLNQSAAVARLERCAQQASTSAGRSGVTQVDEQAAAMLSLGTRVRLRNLLQRITLQAEHRLDVLRVNPFYEASTSAEENDVRLQLRFVEELDEREQNRVDELERDMLIKLSRSKASKTQQSDEQLRLKNKAKELQQAEQDEARAREANLAAQAALGGSKGRKRVWQQAAQQQQTHTSNSPAAGSSGGGGGGGAVGDNPFDSRHTGAVNAMRTQTQRVRVKRVTMKDVEPVLSTDRWLRHSAFTYKLCWQAPGNDQ